MAAAACEELNHSEAWYDAYEELEPAESAVVAETKEASTVMKEEMKHGKKAVDVGRSEF